MGTLHGGCQTHFRLWVGCGTTFYLLYIGATREVTKKKVQD